MVKDAEAHAEEDKKRKAQVEAKNHAEALVHATEKTLAEHGSKVGEAERRAIENAMADLKEALKGDDADAITAKTNALAQASMKLGEAMYKQADRAAGRRRWRRRRRRSRRQEGRRRRCRVHRGRRRQEEQEIGLMPARALDAGIAPSRQIRRTLRDPSSATGGCRSHCPQLGSDCDICVIGWGIDGQALLLRSSLGRAHRERR